MFFLYTRRQTGNSQSLNESQGSQDLSFSLPGVVNRSTPQFIHQQTGIYGIIPRNHTQNVNVLITTPSPFCSATTLQLHLTFQ